MSRISQELETQNSVAQAQNNVEDDFNTNVYTVSQVQPSSDRSIETNSNSYYITSCQDKINKKGTTKDWIQVLNTLQMTREFDKSRILRALLDKKTEVVVKLGDNTTISNEYEVGKKLKTIKGFIKFLCYFECSDKYLNHPNPTRGYLCQGSGKSMKVIVMPYYPLGSMKVYNWNLSNVDAFRSAIKQACLSIISAFVFGGIVHGDFHAHNVLLTPTTTKHIEYRFPGDLKIAVPTHGLKTVVMDFETSMEKKTESKYDVIDSLNKFYFDLQKFFQTLLTYVPHLDSRPMVSINKYISRFSINEGFPIKLVSSTFFDLIDKVTFIE